MGAFYTTILVRGVSRDSVLLWFQQQQRQGVVLPTRDGVTPVFDKKCQAQETKEITRFSHSISKELECTAWAVMNHDDDLLVYWLYRGGELVDQYNSVSPAVYFGVEEPDEFEDETDDAYAPIGGNAGLLCDLMGNGGDSETAASILMDRGPMGGRFNSAGERHQALLEALYINPAVLGTGGEHFNE